MPIVKQQGEDVQTSNDLSHIIWQHDLLYLLQPIAEAKEIATKQSHNARLLHLDKAKLVTAQIRRQLPSPYRDQRNFPTVWEIKRIGGSYLHGG